MVYLRYIYLEVKVYDVVVLQSVSSLCWCKLFGIWRWIYHIADPIHTHTHTHIHTVPMDLDVKMKAVMLGACFLIVSSTAQH